MKNYVWISERQYTINPNGVAHIALRNDGEYRALIAGSEREIAVDREFATAVHSVETRKVVLNRGRPRIVTGEPVEMHGITLPASIWRKIGRPYSANLLTIIYRCI